MSRKEPLHSFPTGVFLATVAVVCLGLAVSAGYTFSTLLRLRTQYLQNRGNEIAVSIDLQARGPGRRNNPAYWQTLIDESHQAYSESVAFFTLVNQGGQVLASRGQDPSSAPGYTRIAGREIFVFELPIGTPRFTPSGISHLEVAWRLRIGLFTSAADSVLRQAIIQVTVAVAAIVMLLVLAASFLRMLRRFLELKAREGSERHLRALGTMAAALAHEIRNPLGAMKGLTQLIQEDLPQDHGAQASIRTVISEAERLERLVSDLLSFARARRFNIAAFDLHKLVSETKAMLQPRLDADNIEVVISGDAGPLIIHSGQDGIRQILLNTMLNALEVSPTGGSIGVTVRQLPKTRELLLEIDDSGPGLGDAEPEELFQPFVTTKFRGTGLGLAVSREIAESLGGSLTLRNLPGGGARCSLRIPLSAGS